MRPLWPTGLGQCEPRNETDMEDREQRERESRESPETQYDEAIEDEAVERGRQAERLPDLAPPEEENKGD